METEIWKDIAGWKGYYEVSSQGRVRSVDRLVPNSRHEQHGVAYFRGRMLKAGKRNADGYAIIVLSRQHKQTSKLVHRLMAQAFLPNPNNHPMVRHLNDVPDDNHIDNLAWGTAVENYDDRRCPHCRERLRK